MPILRYLAGRARAGAHTARSGASTPHAAASPDPAEDRRERDLRLVRRALTDRSAFSELYEAHAGRVYRYLLSRTSNPAEAEELTSRTFLNALARLDQYRGRGAAFSSWLMQIAHNLLVNWYRDRGRRPPTAALDIAEQAPSDLPGPEASLEQNERISAVRRAVSSLPPERQQLIALKYVDGRTNAEIGRIMGRTEGAVKALHHRTLRELQELLADIEDGERPARRRIRS
jgi:RNA polymerase sigma-70 factor, ECF subfamily